MSSSGVVVSSLLGIAAILCLVTVILAVRRQVLTGSLAALLSAYTVGALSLSLVDVIWHSVQFTFLGIQAYSHMQLFGMLALSLMLVYLVRLSLKLDGVHLWLIIGGLIVVLLGMIHGFQIQQVKWGDITVSMPYEYASFTIVTLGWLVFMCASILTARFGLRRIQQPLHRNRIGFWLPIFVFLAMNDFLFLVSGQSWSGLFRIMAVLLLLYSLTQHHLPDFQQILRRVLATLLGIGLIPLIYYVGFRGYALILRSGFITDPFAVGLVLTLVLVIISYPLFHLIWRWISPPASLIGYNPSQAMREYSLSISNILDLERLATVVIEVITTTMNIRHGILFLVDKEMDDNGLPRYSLRRVPPDVDPAPPGILRRDSPVVHALFVEHRPLLQYDIDGLPDYKRTRKTERRWLAGLKAEVFVPIISKSEWIGLLALGDKSSGNRYTADDLNVLASIANQTAVALENARLVSNLVRLNREIRQAYQALDRVTHELERLDRTKSDFISIASHELRTPLTVMRGYTEMMLEEPGVKENPSHLKTMQGIHRGVIRMHEIMDSMFDIANINTRTIEMQMQSTDLTELIQSICDGLKKSVQDRGQTLLIDLPALPSIKADPITLRKVFFHLIANAIKFTQDNGKINIIGRVLNPNNRDLPEGGIEIVVIDSGVGVAPEFQDAIFTKFSQPMEDLNKHSTGKTKFKGSGAGLGLALSKGIVEAHGGRIWVESQGYDEVNFPGSQFHVVLPLRRQGESATIPIGSAVKMKL